MSSSASDAIAHLRQVVEQTPKDPVAHYHLANALMDAQHIDEALAHFDTAIALRPNLVEAHVNRGNCLRLAGRDMDAIASFERAIALRPDLPEAYVNLGNTLHALGRSEEAIDRLQRSVMLRPQMAEARYNLGQVLLDVGNTEAAIDWTNAALALKPELVQGHLNLALAFNRLQRHAEALEALGRALELDPRYLPALNERGNTLSLLGRRAEAISAYEAALAVDPDYVSALVGFGYVLNEDGRAQAAERTLSHALVIDPGNAAARLNLASVYDALERYDEAFQLYDQVIALKPAFLDRALWNMGLLHLRFGRLAQGWPLYEHRFTAAVRDLNPRHYGARRWRGERGIDTLLVWGEQGLGEQILYAGMLPELSACAERILLEVDHRLVPLFARSFPGVHAMAMREGLYPGQIDAHAPMADLGRYLRADWSAFPARAGAYLAADPERVRALRARLTHDGKRIVGISWRSRHPRYEKEKSAQLADFASLLRPPGWRCVDLQYGDTQAERDALARDAGLCIEHLDDIDNTNDIDGLAALIAACDAVVTVSNTTAHLAGALAQPTWVLVPRGYGRLWHWFQDLDDSPWYARVTLLRQSRDQSWSGLATQAAAQLAKLAAAPPV